MKNYFIDENVELGRDVKIGTFVSIYSGTKIGDNCKIEDGAKIFEKCEIGNNCIIGVNAVVHKNSKIGNNTVIGTLTSLEGNLTVGDNTTIHSQCHLTRGLSVGNNVFIGPLFVTTNTPYITKEKHGTNPSTKPNLLPTIIEDNVRIGASVRLTPGNKIGTYSLIDQDTLITRNIPPYSHVKGGKDKVGKVIGKVED